MIWYFFLRRYYELLFVWTHLFWIGFPVYGSQTTSLAERQREFDTVCWNQFCSPTKLISRKNSAKKLCVQKVCSIIAWLHRISPQEELEKSQQRQPRQPWQWSQIAAWPPKIRMDQAPEVVEPAEISVEEEAPKQRSLEERESDSDVIMEIHEVDTSVGLRHVFQSTSLFSQNDGCVSQHSTSPQRAVPNFAKWSHLDPELKMVSFPIPCQPPTIALARGWPKDRPREGDGAGWEGRLRTPSLSEIVHEPWCNWYM